MNPLTVLSRVYEHCVSLGYANPKDSQCPVSAMLIMRYNMVWTPDYYRDMLAKYPTLTSVEA